MRGDIERFEVAVGEMWLSDLNSLDMISDLLLLRDRAPGRREILDFSKIFIAKFRGCVKI